MSSLPSSKPTLSILFRVLGSEFMRKMEPETENLLKLNGNYRSVGFRIYLGPPRPATLPHTGSHGLGTLDFAVNGFCYWPYYRLLRGVQVDDLPSPKFRFSNPEAPGSGRIWAITGTSHMQSCVASYKDFRYNSPALAETHHSRIRCTSHSPSRS